MDAKIVELRVGGNAKHRQFSVEGASTRDAAIAIVAQRVRQGDAHPWCAQLKASEPRHVKTIGPGEHVVAVDYKKGTP